MKYCPVCRRHYEPKSGSEGMAVDCPYCWEGQTLAPQMGAMDPVTACLKCGARLTPGDYGAYWGLCPSCAKERERE